MDTPTDRQLRVLLFIIGYRQQHGYPPGIREICKVVGSTSMNGVMCHLKALRRKGLLTWEQGQARTMRATVEFIPAAQLGSELVGVTEGWK